MVNYFKEYLRKQLITSNSRVLALLVLLLVIKYQYQYQNDGLIYPTGDSYEKKEIKIGCRFLDLTIFVFT